MNSRKLVNLSKLSKYLIAIFMGVLLLMLTACGSESPADEVERELEQLKSSDYLAELQKQVAEDSAMSEYADLYNAFLEKTQDFEYTIVSTTIEEVSSEDEYVASLIGDTASDADDSDSSESEDTSDDVAETDGETSDDSEETTYQKATVVVEIATYDFGSGYLEIRESLLEQIENDDITDSDEIEAYIYETLFAAFDALTEKTYSKQITITLVQDSEGDWVSNLGDSAELRDAIFGGINYVIQNGVTEAENSES